MTSHDDDGGGTSGTETDPETGAEGDNDQLESDDTLLDDGDGGPGDVSGYGSVLDGGYSPPERRPNRHRIETALDAALGESMADKLAEEEPEVWATDGRPVVGAREPDRAGRLAADVSDVMGMPTADTMAVDVGMDGGAASAEEAAMHVVNWDEEAAQAELELAEELGDEDEQD